MNTYWALSDSILAERREHVMKVIDQLSKHIPRTSDGCDPITQARLMLLQYCIALENIKQALDLRTKDLGEAKAIMHRLIDNAMFVDDMVLNATFFLIELEEREKVHSHEDQQEDNSEMETEIDEEDADARSEGERSELEGSMNIDELADQVENMEI